MLSGLIASIAPSIIQAVVGKKLESDGGAAMQITKGLIKSKTANVAHGQLVASLIAIMLMAPETTWTVILVSAAFLVWAKDIILRAITKEPV